MSVLQCNSLSKRYGKIPALEQVSFAIEPGRMGGLLGMNPLLARRNVPAMVRTGLTFLLTALIAPGFGTPTSYLPGSGEYLTPNLVPGALSGGLVNQVGSAGANAVGGAAGSSVIPGQYPSVSGNVTMTQIPGGSPTDIAQGNTTGGYTEVTDDLYYSNGSLGTLKIPAINLTVKVYQGTDSAALKKGAGHFANTSIWDGNVCFAGHNRGVNNHFGKIHTLEAGDTITLTTLLGTRTYSVASVEKVSVNDSSGTAPTTDNRVTLYTCVMDQPEYRWCVTAIQQG